jgi:large subunit ribosomal protein L6
MSRVGKYPVAVPAGVTVEIAGREVTAKGKLGALSVTVADEVDVSREDDKIWVKPRGDSKRARTQWGTSRNLLRNLVTGVGQGYSVKLEIAGVGYRAAVEGSKSLVLQLGYSHEVRFPIPAGISIACATPTQIEVKGADRQRVGQVAAEIRAFRKPEPYKGKGIKYANEQIVRKEGKKK